MNLYGPHLLGFYAEKLSYFYLKKLGFIRFPIKSLQKLCKNNWIDIRTPDFIRIEREFIIGVEVKSFNGNRETLRRVIKGASEQLKYCDYRIVHLHIWTDEYDKWFIGKYTGIDKLVMFKDGQYQRTILGDGKYR